MESYKNKIICDDSISAMKNIETASVSLIVTSPPYWNLIDYRASGQYGQCSYNEYLAQMLSVFTEASRILEPNGKLACITPIVPLPKSVDSSIHTRRLLNISSDIEHEILNANIKLNRFSLYIWQKQTSKKMFGSYPYPPNIYEDNTIEFINVFVKEGTPKKVAKEIKEHSKMTQEEWVNMSMQIWPIMPANINRKNGGGHPAPFPLEIPNRLIAMYTFAKVDEFGFEGDIVLDMFNGSGSTTLSALISKRQYIGIDINIDYCNMAIERMRELDKNISKNLIIDKIRMPSRHQTEQNFDDKDQMLLEV